jgi:P27 family predicted phage terminase small subunit
VKGRKPKPTNLHILNGNPSKKTLNTNEPKPAPIAPKCPAWLNAEGKRHWKYIAPKLERLGLLTEIDGAALACACNEFGEYIQLRRIIKAKGSRTFMTETGYEAAIPEISIANKALTNYKAFLVEFGMTPSSRSRIGIKSDDKHDDMENLLSGVK